MADDKSKINIAKGFETNTNVANLDRIYSTNYMDNMTSVDGMMRTISKKVFNENSVKDVRTKVGQILRIDERRAGDIKTKESFVLNFIKDLTPDTIIKTYKVRIPSIDGLLQIPTGEKSDLNNKILDMYTDYFPINIKDNYSVGDYVEIEFDNNEFLTDGRIVSSYSSQYQATIIYDDSPASSADYGNISANAAVPDIDSAKEYIPGSTPTIRVGKTRKEQGVDKTIKYIIGELSSTANRYPGRFAGKDRNVLMVRIPDENCLGDRDLFLSPKAYDYFMKMCNDYLRDTKSKMKARSAYRTYTHQKELWNDRYTVSWETIQKKSISVSEAIATRIKKNDQYDCAPPGYSNHEPGLALDLCIKEDAKLYDWLVRNAHNYGFRRTVSSEKHHWEFRIQWVGIVWMSDTRMASDNEENRNDTPTGD